MAINPMQSVCADLNSGLLAHSDTEHVLKQLAVEGKRRIDAFVFELMFKRRLKTIVCNTPGLILSFGWHIGYNRYGDPTFWFRLMDQADDWNECDDAMVQRLQTFRIGSKKQPVTVIRVLYTPEQNNFISSRQSGASWGDWYSLETMLGDLPLRGTPRDPRPMNNVNPESASLAFEWLVKNGLREELPFLSIQRRFMNCLLGPGLGKDGTDLDVMVLTPEGQLRYIEFKRKYPAVGEKKFFGLDIWPHLKTIQTMAAMSVSAQHIILVGPIWGKQESPLSWLDNPLLNGHWTWLAANLDGDAFDTVQLHTSGSDSGHRKAERDQASIKWDRIRLLNAGLKLGQSGGEKFIEFFLRGSLGDEAVINFDALFSRQAR